MAAPGSRMRLTVVVESLAEENAHGLFRDEALAAFKERKFAMPVQLENTFETVWNDIEQRYKTNYLDARQAAAFSIKKLQDAYDCDLDMTDTVGAIFEGEPDRKMHMIKVIPHFVYRDTSVLPGSKLRPCGAQKRPGDDVHEGASKRRRVESQQRLPTQEPRDLSPNRPILSTESQHAAAEGAEYVQGDRRSARSKSGMSLVELSRAETGQAVFSSAAVKQESPGLQQSHSLHGIDAAFSTEQSQELPQQSVDHDVLEPENAPTEEVHLSDGAAQAGSGLTPMSAVVSQEAAIHKSPVSSPDAEPAPAPAPAPAPRKRRDVYQVPSSPDFMHKKVTPDKHAKTYGRSPRSAHIIQKEVDLLNMSRLLTRSAEQKNATKAVPATSISNKARAFQRPEPDVIESTPHENPAPAQRQVSHTASAADDDDTDLTASFLDEAAEDRPNGTQTPARKTPAKPVKPGSLKKPSRNSLVATPARAKRVAQSKVASTPVSRASASKSSAQGKTMTPRNAETPKGEKVLKAKSPSRMERLQQLLGTSQSISKRADTTSPARSGSIESRDRSNRSSPEVRILVSKKTTPVVPNTRITNSQTSVEPPAAQRTPMKSPVPLPTASGKSTPLSSTGLKEAAKTPKAGGAGVFKKPAVRVHESPVSLPTTRKVSEAVATGTLRRSEIPLPPNVRNLRRSSSLLSSPQTNGDATKDKSSPSAPVEIPVKLHQARSSVDAVSAKTPVSAPAVKPKPTEPAQPGSTTKTNSDAIVISSADSTSTEYSDSEPGQQLDASTRDMDGTTVEGPIAVADPDDATQTNDATPPDGHTDATADTAVVDDAEHPDVTETLNKADDMPNGPLLTQDKPPSGQGSSQAAPWGTESWSFGSLSQTNRSINNPEQAQEPNLHARSSGAAALDDEGFVEQDTYSTAMEHNATQSRSASAAISARSSPAVSRRPARFLSHSPTPDASESEDEDVSAALSRAASPEANNNKEQSESESSSDSSEDEDVDIPDLLAESATNLTANAVPPSSPPVNATTNSTPIVPETSQSTSSQVIRPMQRTPVPLPTRQSSQAPRSSQSVSMQAADRRRYTGFRSLREQLADTKATQATTQTKTFDPRIMSLGKLAKGKPPMGFGGDEDESSDEESSSSSSDSD